MEILKELRKEEANLIDKLDAIKKVIAIYDIKSEVFHTETIEQTEDYIEPKTRKKVHSLPELICVIEKKTKLELNSITQNPHALCLFSFYSKVMYPNMSYADIGILISQQYQTIMNANRRHEKLLLENTEYFKLNQYLNTEYAIKEIKT